MPNQSIHTNPQSPETEENDSVLTPLSPVSFEYLHAHLEPSLKIPLLARTTEAKEPQTTSRPISDPGLLCLNELDMQFIDYIYRSEASSITAIPHQFDKINQCFESEFFICTHQTIRAAGADPRELLTPLTFLKGERSHLICNAKVEVTDANERGHSGFRELFEARSLPRLQASEPTSNLEVTPRVLTQSHQENISFPSISDSVKEYLSFRDEICNEIQSRYPLYKFTRYSEHLHFSLSRGGRLVNRSDIDPRLSALIEGALRVHWNDARITIDYIPLIKKSRPWISRATKNIVSDSDIDLSCFFLHRYMGALSGTSRENHFHYEVRRTFPGSDRHSRGLPCSPMLIAQALLASAIRLATIAYTDRSLEALLHNRNLLVPEQPNWNTIEACDSLRSSEVLRHPESIGSSLVNNLAEEFEKYYRALDICPQ